MWLIEMLFGVFLFLGWLLDTWGDFQLVVKLFALITIANFVRNHVQGPLAVAIIVGMGWFILFDYWWFFGGIFVLYTLLMLGVSGIMIDFFFTRGMGGEGVETGQAKGSSGDVAMRLAKAKMMQARMRRPG